MLRMRAFTLIEVVAATALASLLLLLLLALLTTTWRSRAALVELDDWASDDAAWVGLIRHDLSHAHTMRLDENERTAEG